ncbi:MAG: YggS family pyridoxal phosphate-dependent enzyme, partial [Actinomycetota bacterium]
MADARTIADRLRELRGRIDDAALRSGRDPSAVRLVVVTKDVSGDRVREALAAGVTDLGENRAQEMTRKMEELAGIAPAPRWHFIGTLQRNKVREVAGHVAMIHSIDSAELGIAVGERAAAAGGVQDALLEVN